MRALALLALLTLAAAPPGEERRLVFSGFDRLRIDGPFVVTVREGSPGAVITGERRALEAAALRVEGSTLVVNGGVLGAGARAAGALPVAQVAVTVPALRALHVNGAARVEIGPMRGDRVDVSLNGAGSVAIGTIEAEALVLTLTGTGQLAIGGGSTGRARVLSYGAGSIEAGGFTAREASVRAESSGSLRLGVRYTAAIAALGAGPVTIEGKPECKVVGPGPVDCANQTRR